MDMAWYAFGPTLRIMSSESVLYGRVEEFMGDLGDSHVTMTRMSNRLRDGKNSRINKQMISEGENTTGDPLWVCSGCHERQDTAFVKYHATDEASSRGK